MYKDIVRNIDMTTFDIGDITAAFKVINPSGFEHACSIVRIENASNVSIAISFDGIKEHDFLNVSESLTLPTQSDCAPSNFVARFEQGTKVYVKYKATKIPLTGYIFLIGYY